MLETLSVAKREFQGIWADPRLRSVVLVAPFVYAALFGCVYSKHSLTDVPIAILMEESTGPTRTLARMLDASPRLAVVSRPLAQPDLEDLILSGSIEAAVIIPRGFTADLKTGKGTQVVAYANAASMVSANTAAKAINEVVQTFSAGAEIKGLMKKGDRLADARRHFMPVRLDLRSLYNPSFNYSNFMVPGLLAAILQQVILLGVALSWTGERERGTLPELFKVSSSPWPLIIGKALPYVLVNFVVAEFYLRVLFPLNDIPMEGSWRLAVPFTALFVVTIVTWGTWVSGLFKSRLFATQVLMFVAMPSFVLSGFTWPHLAMPAWVAAAGKALPLTYFVHSFRNIYLAGAPAKYAVHDILVLSAFTLLNLLACWLVVRRLVNASGGQLEARPDGGGAVLG